MQPQAYGEWEREQLGDERRSRDFQKAFVHAFRLIFVSSLLARVGAPEFRVVL